MNPTFLELVTILTHSSRNGPYLPTAVGDCIVLWALESSRLDVVPCQMSARREDTALSRQNGS
jgi:hypothetical protein